MRSANANKAAVVLLTMLTLLVVSGCGIPLFWTSGDTRPTATPSAVAAVATATPTATPQPTVAPLIAPTPPAIATVTPRPAVSHAEAEGLVRDYFEALDNKDTTRLDQIVAGRAKDTTNAIITQVQQAEQKNRVELRSQTRKLDLLGDEDTPAGVVVTADYSVDVTAHAGFLSVPAQTNAGRARFTVDRVDGQPRIVDITGNLAAPGP